MQIKTKYVSIAVNEEDLSHLTEEERDLFLDELVKNALGQAMDGDWLSRII
jgi:hypothetical protein